MSKRDSFWRSSWMEEGLKTCLGRMLFFSWRLFTKVVNIWAIGIWIILGWIFFWKVSERVVGEVKGIENGGSSEFGISEWVSI